MPHKRCTCSDFRRKPGISIYSERSRASTSCIVLIPICGEASSLDRWTYRGQETVLFARRNLELPKQYDVGFATDKPRPHARSRRKRQGLRDGFFARAEQVLVGTWSGLQDVNERPFPRFLADDNVTVGRSRTGKHDDSFRLCRPSGFRLARGRSSVWTTRKGGNRTIGPPRSRSKADLHTPRCQAILKCGG